MLRYIGTINLVELVGARDQYGVASWWGLATKLAPTSWSTRHLVNKFYIGSDVMSREETCSPQPSKSVLYYNKMIFQFVCVGSPPHCIILNNKNYRQLVISGRSKVYMERDLRSSDGSSYGLWPNELTKLKRTGKVKCI